MAADISVATKAQKRGDKARLLNGGAAGGMACLLLLLVRPSTVELRSPHLPWPMGTIRIVLPDPGVPVSALEAVIQLVGGQNEAWRTVLRVPTPGSTDEL